MINTYYNNLLEHCAQSNSLQYNRYKILEELAEFMEVIIKRETKDEGNPRKPVKKELIKEFGDVIYRGIIYLLQEFPLNPEELTEEIQKHIELKLDKLEVWRNEGTYKGGL